MNQLDLAKVGKSFGFSVPPKVNISVGSIKARKREDGDADSDSDDDGKPKKAYYRKRDKRN